LISQSRGLGDVYKRQKYFILVKFNLDGLKLIGVAISM
jgi:hypothetical protein